MRGYFGIGVYHIKSEVNIGTLWRSAYIMGAAFVFTIGRRYKKQSSDTLHSYRHVPLWHFDSYKDFNDHIPYDCQIVCVDNIEGAIDLKNYNHPQRVIYLLGAEDTGLPIKILNQHQVIVIPSEKPLCLNVSTAGSIVMYDRLKRRPNEKV